MQAVWHPCTQMKHHEQFPIIPIAKGQGIWLEDADGNRYIDGVSSWWVNLFGHANPIINEAIKQQLDQFSHVMLAGFTHEPVVALSEKLASLTGLGHAFYGSDGASATEIALKMSFHYWKNTGLHKNKQRFLCLQHSYHGETLGSLGVTDVALFKNTYAPLLISAETVPSPDARLAQTGETASAYALRCADVLEETLMAHHQEIAAIILEPLVQCATGMAMYDPIYLKRVRQLCDQYQVHMIADEIAVGFGRTGSMFACEQGNITPDFICLSKGITGGTLPLSVTLTNDTIYQAFYDDRTTRGFLHSHSYTGNALACSAALATISIFESDNVIEKNRQKATEFNQILHPLTHHERVLNARHLGMIWAFDIETGSPSFARESYQTAMQSGLLIRPIGNTLYVMPPYCIETEHMHHIRSTFENIIETIA